MMRYIFFIIFEALYILPVLTKGSYINLFWVILLGYTFYLINKVEKTSKQDGYLTSSEKWQVILTELFNPIVSGAFYYYCWKKRFPKKAGQANKYSLITFGTLFLIGIVILFTVGFSTYNSAKNRATEIRQQNQIQK